jgi:hypothetical protein
MLKGRRAPGLEADTVMEITRIIQLFFKVNSLGEEAGNITGCLHGGFMDGLIRNGFKSCRLVKGIEVVGVNEVGLPAVPAIAHAGIGKRDGNGHSFVRHFNFLLMKWLW